MKATYYKVGIVKYPAIKIGNYLYVNSWWEEYSAKEARAMAERFIKLAPAVALKGWKRYKL